MAVKDETIFDKVRVALSTRPKVVLPKADTPQFIDTDEGIAKQNKQWADLNKEVDQLREETEES